MEAGDATMPWYWLCVPSEARVSVSTHVPVEAPAPPAWPAAAGAGGGAPQAGAKSVAARISGAMF